MANPDPYGDLQESPANTGDKWNFGAALAVIVAIVVIIAGISYEATAVLGTCMQS
jgi:ABC-type spermidine/putrescine transport system permease subunit I